MVTGVETPDGVEVDDIGSADTAQTISRGPLWWIHRLAPARLTSRIVLLNIAGLIDLVGNLVVDSGYLYGRGEILQRELPPIDSSATGFWMEWWKRLNEWLFSNDYPHQKEYGPDNGKDFSEVLAALNGASVSVVRV